jgi:hypothetical protein
MTTQADLNAYVQQLQGLGTNQVMWMNGIPMRYTAQGMMPDPQWTQMTDALDSRPGGDGHNTPVNWQQQIQNVGGAISLNQAQQNAGYPGGQRSGTPGGGGGTPGGAWLRVSIGQTSQATWAAPYRWSIRLRQRQDHRLTWC